MEDQELVKIADEARANAYVPYSKFPVGAALLTKSGRVFKGVNVENAAYGLTTCAERNAIGTAVAAGEREFAAIAIVCDSGEYCSPCGSCRQIIAEFGPDVRVIMANKEGEYKVHTIAQLLPDSFKL